MTVDRASAAGASTLTWPATGCTRMREAQDTPGLVPRITVRWIAMRPVRGS